VPLIHSKSKKAFSNNVAEMVKAGHPQNQAVAAAYDVKRKAEHHKAEGGEMKSRKERALEAFHGSMMAEGGQITDNEQSSKTKDLTGPCPECGHESHLKHEMESGFQSHEDSTPKANASAMSEDDRDLNQHGADELGPEDHMAEGGEMHPHQDPHGQDASDLVARVMHQRRYSKGGMVANEDQGESASTPDHMAKDKLNEMDDLALRDDLEFSYDGANSGDEDSDAREDRDREDIVARILRSRAKKAGSLPKSIHPGL
jgi:hypothetical protein